VDPVGQDPWMGRSIVHLLLSVGGEDGRLLPSKTGPKAKAKCISAAYLKIVWYPFRFLHTK